MNNYYFSVERYQFLGKILFVKEYIQQALRIFEQSFEGQWIYLFFIRNCVKLSSKAKKHPQTFILAE